MTQAQNAAASVVKMLLTTHKVDYSHREGEIATFFDEVLYEGNWDSTTDFEDDKNLRFIQEDEYDQSMDEDEQPDNQLGFVSGHYIFWA